MTIRALIVDDEPLARRGVRQLLARHPDVVVVAESRDGRDALGALREHAPDLLFLDVRMPEMDGFGVLGELIASRGESALPVTVFLTAYEEFAVDAFGVDAVDYLVKPVSDERFARSMERVRRRIHERSGPRPGEPAPPAAAHLVIPSIGGKRVVSFDEIDWIGAEDYYAAIHVGGRRHLLRESMLSLESRLDRRRFIRVHRGAIVNTRCIREVRGGGGETVVVLRDGTRLPVSRRRRAALMEALGGVIEAEPPATRGGPHG